MPTAEAFEMAQSSGLDLVEVAPTAKPPVCRILDYGRLKYQQTKKDREARRNQKVVLLKEVRIRPKTGDHDLQIKSRKVKKFLSDGDKVKVTVRFRGREMAHPQMGRKVLEQLLHHLAGIAHIERMPDIEGRAMTMILAPGKGMAGGNA